MQQHTVTRNVRNRHTSVPWPCSWKSVMKNRKLCHVSEVATMYLGRFLKSCQPNPSQGRTSIPSSFSPNWQAEWILRSYRRNASHSSPLRCRWAGARVIYFTQRGTQVEGFHTSSFPINRTKLYLAVFVIHKTHCEAQIKIKDNQWPSNITLQNIHTIYIKKTEKDVQIGTIIKNKISDLMVKHDFQ